MNCFPHVVELEQGTEASTLFRRLAQRPGCLFLDSALRHPQLGRYSFLAVDPYRVFSTDRPEPARLDEALDCLEACKQVARSDLPPFQGGLAGMVGYELGAAYERISAARGNEFQLPQLWLGCYDLVISFDHRQDRAWIVSQGLPETDPVRRHERADRRISELLAWLNANEDAPGAPRPTHWLAAGVVPSDRWVVPERAPLESNLSEDAYLSVIGRAIEYIRAGDIFQVNIAQRLLYPQTESPWEFYEKLRERNPATFAGFLGMGDCFLASASPERFLKVSERVVETRPIKGTRQRHPRPEADALTATELEACEKDRAENVMIVDLLRNDLSRVCLDDSIQVTQLCHVERYEFVQHLVSAVRGELRRETRLKDLFRATFPGGSITGAPKIRAMQIIAELEPSQRGPYCGTLGYASLDGTMDWNILIRTVTGSRGWLQFPVGGGIVAPSDPKREYRETWDKAEGILRALG